VLPWAQRLLSVATAFEVLDSRPKPEHVARPHVKCVQVTTTTTTTTMINAGSSSSGSGSGNITTAHTIHSIAWLAYLERDEGSARPLGVADENEADAGHAEVAEVARWKSLIGEATRRQHTGPLGEACVSRLRLEAANHPPPGARPGARASDLASPNTLLTTFMEVYLPYGFGLNHEELRGVCRPAGHPLDLLHMRLRDPNDVVSLPGFWSPEDVRALSSNVEFAVSFNGCLTDGTLAAPRQRPLRDLLAEFHELLGGWEFSMDVAGGAHLAQPTRPPYLMTFTKRLPWDAEEGGRVAMDVRAPLALLPHEAAAPPYARLDVDEHVSALVMRHVFDWRDRLALECVGSVGVGGGGATFPPP
jgi:hypothetical protein